MARLGNRIKNEAYPEREYIFSENKKSCAIFIFYCYQIEVLNEDDMYNPSYILMTNCETNISDSVLQNNKVIKSILKKLSQLSLPESEWERGIKRLFIELKNLPEEVKKNEFFIEELLDKNKKLCPIKYQIYQNFEKQLPGFCLEDYLEQPVSKNQNAMYFWMLNIIWKYRNSMDYTITYEEIPRKAFESLLFNEELNDAYLDNYKLGNKFIAFIGDGNVEARIAMMLHDDTPILYFIWNGEFRSD